MTPRRAAALFLAASLPAQAFAQTIGPSAPLPTPAGPLPVETASETAWPALDAWLSERLELPPDPSKAELWKIETGRLLRAEPEGSVESAVARAYAKARGLGPEKTALAQRLVKGLPHVERAEPAGPKLYVINRRLFEDRGSEGFFEKLDEGPRKVEDPSLLTDLRIARSRGGLPRRTVLLTPGGSVVSSKGRIYERAGTDWVAGSESGAEKTPADGAFVKASGGGREPVVRGDPELHLLPEGRWRLAPAAPAGAREAVLKEAGMHVRAAASSPLPAGISSEVWADLAGWMREAFDAKLEPEALRLETAAVLRQDPGLPLPRAVAVAAARAGALEPGRAAEIEALLGGSDGLVPVLENVRGKLHRAAFYEGRLYVGSSAGLYVQDGQRWGLEDSDEFRGRPVEWVSVVDGALYASASHKLFLKQKRGWKLVFEGPDATWNFRGVEKIRKTLYVGGNGGLYSVLGRGTTQIDRHKVFDLAIIDGELKAAMEDGISTVSGARVEPKESDEHLSEGHPKLIRKAGGQIFAGLFARDIADLGGRAFAIGSKGVSEWKSDRWEVVLQSDEEFKRIYRFDGKDYLLSGSKLYRWVRKPETLSSDWQSAALGSLAAVLESKEASPKIEIEQKEAGGDILSRGRTIFSGLASKLASKLGRGLGFGEIQSAPPDGGWDALSEWARTGLGIKMDSAVWKRETARVLRNEPGLPFLEALSRAAPTPESEKLKGFLENDGLVTMHQMPWMGGIQSFVRHDRTLYAIGIDGARKWVGTSSRASDLTTPDGSPAAWVGVAGGRLYVASRGKDDPGEQAPAKLWRLETGGWKLAIDDPALLSVVSVSEAGGRVYVVARTMRSDPSESPAPRLFEARAGRLVERPVGVQVRGVSEIGGRPFAITDRGVVDLENGVARELGAPVYFVKQIGRTVYVGTSEGLQLNDADFRPLGPPNKETGGARELMEAEGRLWLAADRGVFVQDGDSWKKAAELVKGADHIAEAPGGVYIGTLDKVLRLTPRPNKLAANWQDELLRSLGNVQDEAVSPSTEAPKLDAESGSITSRGRSIFTALVARLASWLYFGFGPAPAPSTWETVAQRFGRALGVAPAALRVDDFRRELAARLEARPELSTEDAALDAFASVHSVPAAKADALRESRRGRLEPLESEAFRIVDRDARFRRIDGVLYAATSVGLFVRNGVEWKRLLVGSIYDVTKVGGSFFLAADSGLLEHSGAGPLPGRLRDWRLVAPGTFDRFETVDGSLLAYRNLRCPLEYVGGRWKQRVFPISFEDRETRSILRVGDRLYRQAGDCLQRRVWFFWWTVRGFESGVRGIAAYESVLYVNRGDSLWEIGPGRAPRNLRPWKKDSIAMLDGVLFAAGPQLHAYDGSSWRFERSILSDIRGLQALDGELALDTVRGYFLWRPKKPLVSHEETTAMLDDLAALRDAKAASGAPIRQSPLEPWSGLSLWVESSLGLRLDTEAWRRETASILRSQPDLALERALALGAAKTTRLGTPDIGRIERFLSREGLLKIELPGGLGAPNLRAAAIHDGRLYVAGRSEIYSFDGRSWSMESAAFRWLGVLGGKLYAAAMDGLFEKTHQGWREVDAFPRGQGQVIEGAAVLDDALYVGTHRGVYRLGDGKVERPLADAHVRHLAAIDGRLLASTDKGLYEIDEGPRPIGGDARDILFAKRIGFRTYVGAESTLSIEKNGALVEEFKAPSGPIDNVADAAEFGGRLHALALFSGLYSKKDGAWSREAGPITVGRQLVEYDGRVYIVSDEGLLHWTPKPAGLAENWKTAILATLPDDGQNPAAPTPTLEKDENGSLISKGRSIFSALAGRRGLGFGEPPAPPSRADPWETLDGLLGFDHSSSAAWRDATIKTLRNEPGLSLEEALGRAFVLTHPHSSLGEEISRDLFGGRNARITDSSVRQLRVIDGKVYAAADDGLHIGGVGRWTRILSTIGPIYSVAKMGGRLFAANQDGLLVRKDDGRWKRDMRRLLPELNAVKALAEVDGVPAAFTDRGTFVRRFGVWWRAWGWPRGIEKVMQAEGRTYAFGEKSLYEKRWYGWRRMGSAYGTYWIIDDAFEAGGRLYAVAGNSLHRIDGRKDIDVWEGAGSDAIFSIGESPGKIGWNPEARAWEFRRWDGNNWMISGLHFVGVPKVVTVAGWAYLASGLGLFETPYRNSVELKTALERIPAELAKSLDEPREPASPPRGLSSDEQGSIVGKRGRTVFRP